MKNLFLRIVKLSLLSMMFYSTGYGQPPGDPVDPSLANVDDGENPRIKCFQAEIKSISNRGAINLDCPENAIFSINILKNQCGCNEFEITIGGIVVKKNISNGPNLLVFSKHDLVELGLKTGSTFLSVKIRCVTNISTLYPLVNEGAVSIPINIVKTGMEYEMETSVSHGQALADTPVSNDELTTICCNKDYSIEITNTKADIKINGSGTTWTFSPLDLSIKIGEYLSYKFPIQFKHEVITSNNITLTNQSKHIYLLKGVDPGCVGIGYQIIGDIYHFQKYIASCNVTDQPVGPERIVYAPVAYRYKTFNVEPDSKSICPPIKPKRAVTDINFFNRIACTGSLELEFESTEGLFVSWTDENGNVVNTPNGNLEDVPFGRYTVNVSDKCCNKYEETFYICNQTVYSAYQRNSNDEWCRNVQCNGEGCTENYEECVTPDRIVDRFDIDQKKCIKEYFLGDVLIGAEYTEAATETEYDDIFEECVTKYLCNGSEVYSDKYEPSNSDWSYDEFFEECQLTVDCRGVEIDNVSQIEAEISWEWDDFYEECVSKYVLCDNSEVDIELTTDAYDIGDWELSSDRETCIRTIECIDGGDTFEQEIEAEWDQCFTCFCSSTGERPYDISCDGEDMGLFCIDEFNSPLNTRVKSSNLVRIGLSDNVMTIRSKNVLENPSSINIYDITGRINTSRELPKSTGKVTSIAINNIPNGIYVVTVISNGKIVHSEKLFINQ